ncbi:hypothetical protein [Tabrizicola sp. M-4]|uniref:hypothetical protein n=1 Tax=Tabrizicola sp. M-4 TaxID=3055847 RepID=UPI003DA9A873
MAGPPLQPHGGGVTRMCHGHLDPRHAMRDIEARVKHLSVAQEKTKQATRAPLGGLLARLRDAVNGLLRKDRAHV